MTAEHVVVSTGAQPIIPDIPRLRDSAVVAGITGTQLRDEIYTHPFMTEAFNQLLGALA